MDDGGGLALAQSIIPQRVASYHALPGERLE
jgi:hypothetical protein